MFVRTITHKRGEKSYAYVQLVESYRRPGEKVPRQRIVANLGDLAPSVVENLKVALEASRRGKSVVLAPEAAEHLVSGTHDVTGNLDYLGLAVMREIWHGWGLSTFLDDLDEQTLVPTSQIIEILTLQRAIGVSGSKSHAERWFPSTALPELMNIVPGHFNNTRIHRALDALHFAETKLTEQLPKLYQSRHGNFCCCFMDVTRTHFEGACYDEAEPSKTKRDGDVKKRIGIVLLVNEMGYPLRWKTIGGRTSDVPAMGDMTSHLVDEEWLRDVPIVFDRAMGQEKTVRSLLAQNVHFLTAARAKDIDSYAPTTRDGRPTLPASVVGKVPLNFADESSGNVLAVREAARATELVEVDPYLFVKDLGTVHLRDDDEPAKWTQDIDDSAGDKLRLVAYFNPQLFVELRYRAHKQLQAFDRFIASLNEDLSKAKRSRNEKATLGKIQSRLKLYHWVELFTIKLHPYVLEGTAKTIRTFRCEVKLHRDMWLHRQRYQGFVLLLAHPSLRQTAAELALLYRSKDLIEKDFQTIKSSVKLRPVFHYTDPKVKAHVTLCMLALLLQRTLESQLKTAGLQISAPAALETLTSCHLNQMKTGALYSLTAPTKLQKELLKALKLTKLVDSSALTKALTPRASR